MNRARHVIAATLVGAVSFASISPFAQSAGTSGQAKPPELKSVLAGKKFTPPIKGQADVDFVKSPTKREGSTLVTRILVKNTSNAPIPRLTIDETWYDKNNNMIPGGKGIVNGLLQPGEVKTVEVRTPVNPNMNTSTLMFSHANGPVKPHAVKTLEDPDKAATKAPAKKK
jgi:hypothetical protein